MVVIGFAFHDHAQQQAHVAGIVARDYAAQSFGWRENVAFLFK